MERLILDKNDLNILSTLARNGRTSYNSIGSQIGLTAKSVKARVKNMIRSGVIERFIVKVNPAGFSYRTALILTKTNNGITKDDAACQAIWISSLSCASYGKNFCGCPSHQEVIK